MKHEKTIRIGCIGDSITAGTGLANPSQEAFPAHLEKLLPSNVTVLNFGNGGKTMRSDLGVDSYVNSNTYQNLMQEAESLDIVTVMLGTNDAYHAKGWTDYEVTRFKNDYKALLASLAEKNPTMQFVLMNSPACFGEKPFRYNMTPLRAFQSELVNELNESGCKIHFFDMYSVTKPLEEHFPDQLHPDKDAHLIMAQALSKPIAEMLIIKT